MAPQVSVFDSSVQGGDAVWEGIRVYNGKVFCLDRCVSGCIMLCLSFRCTENFRSVFRLLGDRGGAKYRCRGLFVLEQVQVGLVRVSCTSPPKNLHLWIL